MSNRNSNRKRRGNANSNRRIVRKSRRRRPLMQTTHNSAVENGSTLSLARRNGRGLVLLPRFQLVPESIIVDLVCNDTQLKMNNAGQIIVSKEYYINDLTAVDPTGGLSVPGFVEWGAFYDNFRVLGAGWSIDLVNLDAAPVQVVGIPMVFSVGNNYSQLGELFANPLASQSVISMSGGMDKTRLKGFVDLGRLFGNSVEYLSDPNFIGNQSTGPTLKAYFTVGGASSSVFTANKGVFFRLTFTFKVLFTGRKIQTG